MVNRFGIVILGNIGDFMRMRHFGEVEEKNSRIKWEKADPVTKQKLSAAINKYSFDSVPIKVVRVLVFTPGLFILVPLIIFLSQIKNSDTPLVVSIIVYASLAFFAIVFLNIYIKFRPYLYPERQPDIWIFQAKCDGREAWGRNDGPAEREMYERQPDIWIFQAKCDGRYACVGRNGEDFEREVYFANFQKAGGRMRIKISEHEYESNPIGEKYIFYKFNDRCGNRWAAIEKTKL